MNNGQLEALFACSVCPAEANKRNKMLYQCDVQCLHEVIDFERKKRLKIREKCDESGEKPRKEPHRLERGIQIINGMQRARAATVNK